jgi:hypothetical protein
MLIEESIILFISIGFKFLPTVLYNVRGAWRSVNEPAFSAGLEAANPTNIFFSSKLTEPRANPPERTPPE